jgi:hypothetical protein
LFIATLAAGLIAGCGTHELTGDIEVNQPRADVAGKACSVSGGYSDIQPGAMVVIKNQDGKILATGHLDAGKVVNLGRCDFAFLIQDVPDADFYLIEVSHRGEVTYSKKDLEGQGWKISLTLG